jgi:starvation-inducible outer membrane lipoprotein
MKILLIVLLLTGCATTQPELPEGAESSAAVGSASFWRWAGKVVMQLVTNTQVKVEVKTEGANQ